MAWAVTRLLDLTASILGIHLNPAIIANNWKGLLVAVNTYAFVLAALGTETCPMPCAAPCTWSPCSERCDKTLSCGCRCRPSACGEECPDAKFCQQHGSDDIKAMQADLLMLTPYKDIDLDVEPCIFTPCGRVFTIDSLDGTWVCKSTMRLTRSLVSTSD